MKLTPINRVLLVLVILLGGIELLRGGEGQPQREIGRLFPDFFTDQAQRLEIEGPDGLVQLEREGEAWVVSNRFGHPAREESAALLLRALASITTLDLLTEDPGRHSEYGLEEGHTRVRAWNATGDQVVDLIQGNDSPDSRACYVHRLGDAAVYRAAQLSRIPAAPTRWLDSAWFPFEPSIVKRIEVHSEDLEEPRVLVREERRYVWREGERVVAKSKVDDLLQSVQSLFLSDVIAEPGDAGSQVPDVALRIELTLLDERVLVGEFAGPEEGLVRARRRDPDGWVVALPEGAVGVVVSRALGL